MARKKEKIELVCWRHTPKIKSSKSPARNVHWCACGFVVGEDKEFVTVASTRGNDGFTDKVKIQKGEIVEHVSLKKIIPRRLTFKKH